LCLLPALLTEAAPTVLSATKSCDLASTWHSLCCRWPNRAVLHYSIYGFRINQPDGPKE
jgi:hypothetical protein